MWQARGNSQTWCVTFVDKWEDRAAEARDDFKKAPCQP